MQVQVNVGTQNMTCEFDPLHSAAFTDPFMSHSHEKLRPELVDMVTRQLDKWPSHLKFNPSKTKKRVLREVLLNASYGFTVTAPADEPDSSHTGAEPAEAEGDGEHGVHATGSGGTPGADDDEATFQVREQQDKDHSTTGSGNNAEGSAAVCLFLVASALLCNCL